MLKHRLFLPVLAGIFCLPLLLLSGCGDDTKKDLQGPPNNIGLWPLRVGNTWYYDVNRSVIDCTDHPLVQCRYDECVENDCVSQKNDSVAQCYDTYNKCLLDGSPVDICEADLASCLSDVNTSYGSCVDRNCSYILKDPMAIVCGENTCFYFDDMGNPIGGTATCQGREISVPACDTEHQLRFFTDTVSSLQVINGVVNYTINGDQYRFNGDGGVYYYGSRGSKVYDNPILEFAYPAPVGYQYRVNYEERGSYEVAVISINEKLDATTDPELRQALTRHNGGQPFYCYHYRFVARNRDNCGCLEVFDYWIAPGVGIVKVDARFSRNSLGEYVKNYRQLLKDYAVQEITFE